jgi:hypothetical protein
MPSPTPIPTIAWKPIHEPGPEEGFMEVNVPQPVLTITEPSIKTGKTYPVRETNSPDSKEEDMELIM